MRYGEKAALDTGGSVFVKYGFNDRCPTFFATSA
jgi:hypothetical protein